MRKLLILSLLFMVSGCASFGRGVAEAIINDKKEDTRQCEIQGSPLPGIDDLFKNKQVVKVMMVHGVGTHTPGYATRIRENLAALACTRRPPAPPSTLMSSPAAIRISR